MLQRSSHDLGLGSSRTASSLGSSSDSRSGGSGVLGLVLSLSVLASGFSLVGLLLSGLLGLGSLLVGSLLSLGSSLLGLVALGGALALDGSTELGESTTLGLLFTVHRSRRLLTLAEGERKRRLALLLDVLLGLAVGGSGVSGLSVVDIISKRSSRLDRRDNRGILSGSRSLVSLGGISRLGLGSLLLLLAEDTAEDAVTLAGSRLLLGALGLLGRLLLSRSSTLGGSRLLSLGGLGISGLVLSSSLRGSSRLLSLGEVLLAEAEERGTLAAGRAALGLFGLGLLLSSLAFLLGSLSLVGLLRLGLLLGSLSRLLLLRSGLQALKGVLVCLRLGDGGGELLGLSNLSLELGNPAVTLGGIGGLESVLAALGSKVELVGAFNLGLTGVGLPQLLANCVKLVMLICEAYQVDDTRGSLLVAGEEKALAGMSSPGDVVESSLGVLLALLVSVKSLGLEGLVAEEEEFLAGNQVPGVQPC